MALDVFCDGVTDVTLVGAMLGEFGTATREEENIGMLGEMGAMSRCELCVAVDTCSGRETPTTLGAEFVSGVLNGLKAAGVLLRCSCDWLICCAIASAGSCTEFSGVDSFSINLTSASENDYKTETICVKSGLLTKIEA